jgi:hypothetical protein
MAHARCRSTALAQPRACGARAIAAALALVVLAASGGLRPVGATEPQQEPATTPADAGGTEAVDAEAVRFFESHVRPVLLTRCVGCHGPDKQKADLRVDSLAALLTGGESGAALVPGDVEASNLVAAIRHDGWEMPPDGRLPDEQIAAIERWVAMGAPWPGASAAAPAAAPRAGPKITDQDRAWWAYQPVRRPEVPPAGPGASDHPIDRFIVARLTAEGLGPAEPADPAVLVRRLFLDVTGMPPTDEEAAAFLADPSGDAADRLVDRLLDDPRYGERLARSWLDLVRYADSDGFRQDAFRPDAWRYRDWVIDSFNAGMPFDRFVALQLAGDEIAPDDPAALVATGFMRHGPYEYNQADVRGQWTSIVDEITDVTADVFLALGMGCAKCHDHKFDPLLQSDYFRLRAFFAPVTWRDDVPLAGPDERRAHDERVRAWREAAGDAVTQLEALLDPTVEVRAGKLLGRFPADIQALFRKPPAERSPDEEQLVQLAARQVRPDAVAKALAGERKEAHEALVQELAAFDGLKPAPLDVGATVSDVGPVAPPTRMPGGRSREPLEPGFPVVLGGADAACTPLPAGPATAGSTGRRSALARWIASPDNPLTARVFVNRLWQRHFGRGLAANTSDFGRLGEPPTHPDLLDWLASEFVAAGWSVKHVERLILTSATYRQSSRPVSPGAAPQLDPLNTFVWRAPCRRLDAEQVRDSALLVAGVLDPARRGPGVPASTPRRGIYTRQLRNTRDPLFDVFDGADAYLSTPLRNVTTTPTQALFLLNGEWTLARAQEFAIRIERTAGPTDEARAAAAARAVFGPGVERATVERLAAFLAVRTAQVTAELAAGPAGRDGWVAAPMPHREGQAAVIDPAIDRPTLHVPAASSPPVALPDGDLTIEASFVLGSLFPDATVRTIAARWSGANTDAGWSLGVTSEKSAHRPRNLIVQLCDGGGGYAVVASDIHVDLNVPYSVAASVHMAAGGGGHVTFVVRDLSDNDAETVVKQVPHAFAGGHGGGLDLTIGGRDRRDGPGTARAESAWDGVIDDVRLTARTLERGELWMDGGAGSPHRVGEWRFEEAGGFTHDSSGNGLAIAPRSGRAGSGPAHEALVDLCHVLLNSSGFLYAD